MAIDPNALTGFMDGFTQAVQLGRQFKQDKAAEEERAFQRERQLESDRMAKEQFGLRKAQAEREAEKFEYENSEEQRRLREQKEKLNLDVLSSQLRANNLDIDLKGIKIENAKDLKETVGKLTALRNRRPLVEEIINNEELGAQFDNLVLMGQGKINPNVDPRTTIPMFARLAQPEVSKALGQKATKKSWAFGKGQEGGPTVQEGAELVALDINDVRTNSERGTAALVMTAQWRNPDGSLAVVPNTLATKDRDSGLDDNILEVRFEDIGKWTSNLSKSVALLSKLPPEQREAAYLSGEQALMQEISLLSGGKQTGETPQQKTAREIQKEKAKRERPETKPLSEKDRLDTILKIESQLAKLKENAGLDQDVTNSQEYLRLEKMLTDLKDVGDKELSPFQQAIIKNLQGQ